MRRSPQEIADSLKKFGTDILPKLAKNIQKSAKKFEEFLGSPSPLSVPFSELLESRIQNFLN